jgi:outer membrane receptor for ferrienterochelin and colicin
MRSAIAVLAFSSTCFAQDAAVVITAPRFPEEIRRLPASVTLITEEDIKQSAARTLPELQAEAGITMKDFSVTTLRTPRSTCAVSCHVGRQNADPARRRRLND